MIRGGHVPTAVELRQLDYDNLLNEQARATCRVGPVFYERLDGDAQTDEDQRQLDSDIDAKSSEDNSDEDSNTGSMTLDVEDESY